MIYALIGTITMVLMEVFAVIFMMGKQFEFNRTTRVMLDNTDKSLKELKDNHLKQLNNCLGELSESMSAVKQRLEMMDCPAHLGQMREVGERVSCLEGKIGEMSRERDRDCKDQGGGSHGSILRV